MGRKFCDLKASDLSKRPGLTYDHSRIGEERIYLRLFNKNKADGLTSGQCSTEEIPILVEYVKLMICQPDLT